MAQDDESGSAATLAFILLLALLGLGSLAVAVGSLVPAVANLLPAGAGRLNGWVGLAFAAVLLGGAVAGALFWWRSRLMPLDVESGSVANSLPRGPGLTVRWLVAVPLMILSVALPKMALVSLAAYESEASELPDLLLAEWVTPAIMAGQLVFLVWARAHLRLWPVIVLWSSAWIILINVVATDLYVSTLPLTAGVYWLSYELMRAAVRVLSWPPTEDVARSTLEVIYKPRGQRHRLHVQNEQLLLTGIPDQPDRHMRWPKIDEISIVRQEGAVALRIVSGDDEWNVPTTELVGQHLVLTILVRAKRFDRFDHAS
jgi:hypothetical protein